MSALDVNSFDRGLKILYPDGFQKLWYEESILAAWIPKATDFTGKQWNIVPLLSGTRGSTDFTKAQQNKNAVDLEEFVLKRRRDYVIISIDAEVIHASKGYKGAIREALQTQTDGAMYEFGRSCANQLWGNGGGSRGKIKSISTDTITLTDGDDVRHFELGQLCTIAGDDGSGAAPAGIHPGTSIEVSGINEDDDQVTFTTNVVARIPAALANDFLFREGDYDNVVTGIPGWMPTTAPAPGDSFFGVDRSRHVSRLAGGRIDGNGNNMEDVIFDAMARNRKQGGKADTLFVNSLKFAELIKSVHSQTWIHVQTDVPGIGYRALAFPTSKGVVKVIDEPDCPEPQGYLTRRSAWLWRSLGKVPHFAMEDGLKFRAEASGDAVEARLRCWSEVGCKTPKDNTVITW